MLGTLINVGFTIDFLNTSIIIYTKIKMKPLEICPLLDKIINDIYI